MGGFPITAAAQKAPDHIAALVYLCAYLPRPGMTLAEMRKAGPGFEREIAHIELGFRPDGDQRCAGNAYKTRGDAKQILVGVAREGVQRPAHTNPTGRVVDAEIALQQREPDLLELRCPREHKMRVLAWLASAELSDLQIHEPSLEDVYFGLREAP